MAISELVSNNPYITGFRIQYKEGDESLERLKIIPKPSVRDRSHLVTEYDTIWDIAFDMYGNSKLWWIIADANNIDHPMFLEVNSTITIPDLVNVKAILP